MPRVLPGILLAAVAACECAPAPPPPAPPAPPAPAPPPQPVDVSVPPKPVWEPASLTPADLKRFDTYAAFSHDALAFVFVAPSAGAGVPVATFLAATTNTVERTVALADDAARRKFAAELADAGFPGPGAQKPVPPILGASVRDGKAQVTFSGMPACAPIALAEAEGRIEGAKVVGVSETGKRVAVRLEVRGTGEFGSGTHVRVVDLFE